MTSPMVVQSGDGAGQAMFRGEWMINHKQQLVIRCTAILIASTGYLFAQGTPGDDIKVFLDEEDRIVFYSEVPGGFETLLLSVLSDGGAIVPIPSEGGTAAPAPFEVLLANTPNQITWGNLGRTYNVEGNLTFDARWNRGSGIADLRFEYGDGPRLKTISLPDGFFEACVSNCGPQLPEHLLFSLDPLNRFVVSGSGQEIVGLSFRSATNELTTGQSSGPFDTVESQSSERINFLSTEPLVVEGSFTLDAGMFSPDASVSIDATYATGEVLTHKVSRSIDWIRLTNTSPLETFTVSSTNAPLDAIVIPDFISVVERTNSEITFGALHELTPEVIGDFLQSWRIDDSESMYVNFTLADGRDYGPIPISRAVPEPDNSLLIFVFLMLGGRHWACGRRSGESDL